MVAQAIDPRDDDIDDAADKLRDALAGLPHAEEWLIADDLEIDHGYQRKKVRWDWVRQIADAFDPDLLRPLLVNRRRWDNNRLMVMDGQHRLLAIRRMGWGDQLVPCLVYDNLSYASEAKQFDTQGNTRPLTAQERFRSALERHEADEEIIDGLVRRAGYRLNLDHGDQTEGRIPAVQKLKDILRQHRSGMLGDVLEICRDGLGTDIGPSAPILAGVAKFLARYRAHEAFDRHRLVTALNRMSVNGLHGEAIKIRVSMGIPIADAVAFVIHKAYNERLRGDRLLPAWTVGRGSTKTK